jgi:hypothetical protein
MRRPGWPFPRSSWQRHRDARRLAREHPERLSAVMYAVIEVLAQGRVDSQRKLRDAVRRVLGCCSDGDVDAAVELLRGHVRRSIGARGATQYALTVAPMRAQWRVPARWRP